MKWFVFISFLSFLTPCFGQVPLLQDTLLINRINHSLEYIYNLEYEKGDSCIAVFESELGERHSMVNLIRAFQIYWRSRPIAQGSKEHDDYILYLNNTIDYAELMMENPELEDEAIFYSLAGAGMLAELYSEEGEGIKVMGQANKAYGYLKKGFERTDSYPDFYFSNGLYNYYREKYPELHPFYKSFLWIFPNGDKAKGIDNLKSCIKDGIFARQMAYLYLFHIYLRYENNGELALPYAEFLFTAYPQNNRFKTVYTESLIAVGQYKMAEPLADELARENRLFFSVPGFLFKGMAAEGLGEISLAKVHYNKALKLSKTMKKSEAHIVSTIYAGLARVSIAENNRDEAEKNYKLALKHDPYTPVFDEAHTYLD